MRISDWSSDVCSSDLLARVERRVMSAIELCRTAALGGHIELCSACGLVRHAYNSCRNRHCPKSQGQARAEWLAARQAELLDRTSVVEGKSVLVRLDPGGRRTIKKKKNKTYQNN